MKELQERSKHQQQGGGGGATTTGPDATPPPTVCQNFGGGGGAGGCGGRVRPGGGGGCQVGGTYVRPTTPHAYLQGGCVSGAGLGKLLVAVVSRGCRWAGVSTVVVLIFTLQQTTFV